MKTKKIVSILVSAAILAGLLSACGGKQNTPGTSSQAPGSASQSQPQICIRTHCGHKALQDIIRIRRFCIIDDARPPSLPENNRTVLP